MMLILKDVISVVPSRNLEKCTVFTILHPRLSHEIFCTRFDISWSRTFKVVAIVYQNTPIIDQHFIFNRILIKMKMQVSLSMLALRNMLDIMQNNQLSSDFFAKGKIIDDDIFQLSGLVVHYGKHPTIVGTKAVILLN